MCEKNFPSPKPGNLFRTDDNDGELARGKPRLIYPRGLLRMRYSNVVKAGPEGAVLLDPILEIFTA